jgi:hypothetical protein
MSYLLQKGLCMRMLAVVVGVALVAVTLTGVADATPPRQVTFDIADSFTDEFLSEQCGVEVVFSIAGHLKATARYNAEGVVVSETDRQPSSTITYSSPDTGRSFSFPNALPSHWDYGAGAAIGSPVTVKFTGLLGHVPGVIASDAGQIVVIGVVRELSPEGVPIVDLTDQVLVEHGNREGDAHIGAICQALI